MENHNQPDWYEIITKYSFSKFSGTLMRMVESQNKSRTVRKLVDSLKETDLLEEMLDESKPNFPDSIFDFSHLKDHLLTTPWRYPPLEWGSRFGEKRDTSLFYGSIDNDALFREVAYYRFLFYFGPTTPVAETIESSLCKFTADFYMKRSARLEKAPFLSHRAILAHPEDYTECHKLSKSLRDQNCDGISFFSSRSKRDSINVALYDPSAITSEKSQSHEEWICETSKEQVTLYCNNSTNDTDLLTYDINDFLHNGSFPSIA